MGTYLNPNNANFLEQTQELYVDKTMLIDVTNSFLDKPTFKFICISRPRRFGKSIAEDMLAAYYSKGADSRELFSRYKISKTDSYGKYLNKFNVIKFDLNARLSVWKALSPKEKTDGNVIAHIARLICDEFREEFSDIDFGENNSVADFIQKVFKEKGETFIIIIDEYDVMVREQVPQEEFDIYLAFLNSLFKNAELKPAISLAYITGILPIIKDKIQSKLNTFKEYNMLYTGKFAEFTGFTTEDVKLLCDEYNCSFDECKSWYNGYKIEDFEIYNPQAVVNAVVSGKFRSYWSHTSTYEVVAEKIQMNFDGIKDDVITMLGGGKIDVNVDSYKNSMTIFDSKDDVFTFLIHLGYLAYDEENEQCYIPNREIYKEWQLAIKTDSDYTETNKIIEASKNLLKETLAGNEQAVADALDLSHIHVTSNKSYNNEESLQSAIYLAFIYAINNYTIVKEMTAGKGFADIVYIPLKGDSPALIVELKHNKSANTALTQIKEKHYFDCLSNYSGELLFVGVNYDEDTKTHECKIEKFVK
ncbi:AAA family ATPase [uncultured Treponema sp.]|uniref:AAA family ATPase n=1 Tax=uncultured Treponema sp. TaxID=162155 RepID=UPI0025EFDEB1|nr:AAA family ATPase [uncultured Treponema sp.]